MLLERAKVLFSRAGSGNLYQASVVLGDGWRLSGYVQGDSEESAEQLAKSAIREKREKWSRIIREVANV